MALAYWQNGQTPERVIAMSERGKLQMEKVAQTSGQMSLFDPVDISSTAVQGLPDNTVEEQEDLENSAVKPAAADRADMAMVVTADMQSREDGQQSTDTSEAERRQEPEQLSGRPVNKVKIPCTLSPSTMMQLLLYAGSGSAHEYRARLRWLGSRAKAPCVEHYCSSIKDAQTWARGAGEAALVARSSTADLGDLSPGIRLRLAVRILDLNDGSGLKAFFDSNPKLVEELSQKPITAMTAAEFGRGIYAAVGEHGEQVIQEAVRAVNTVLSMCQTYGILHKRIHIYRNIKKHDKYHKAMMASLRPRVMTGTKCARLYSTCVERVEKNDYYIGGLIELKMGLALGELCALKFCDICGVDDPPMGEDTWSMPKSDVWFLKIHRFYRKKLEDGKQSYVLTTATLPYKYRPIAIPPDLREELQKYIAKKEATVSGNSWLIPAHSGSGGIQPEAIRKFLQHLLLDCGIKDELTREVFLPRKDDLSEDKKIKLPPNINIFRSNVLYWMRQRCEVEEHAARAYLGLPPATVTDKHYWEPYDTPALLRMYGLLSRWDLRQIPLTDVPVPEPQELSGEQVHAEFPAPIGHTAEVSITAQGAPGEAMHLNLRAKYGLNCRYVVTHKETDP